MNFSHLNRDVRPVNQPEGTYQYGKNGVIDYIRKSVINEPGFELMAALAPYNIIGVIETDRWPVIISTDNTNSAFGFFDELNETYIPICNDASLPFRFGFNLDRFVTGQAQRNYKNEIVIFVTDGETHPYYINCDAFGSPTSIEQVKFFPAYQTPTITTQAQAGGTLVPGAYYVSLKYISIDGTETGAVTISPPEIIIGGPDEISDKAINIALSNLDPDYSLIQIIIISKINGKISVQQVANPVQVNLTGSYTYTGSELTEDLTLEEVLIPPAIYDKVRTAGQLNDALYIGDLVAPKKIRMQKWANLVRIRWSSKPITVSPVYENMTNGKEKSFMHREVYALYIRYKKTRGGFTEFFHIPGPAAGAGDEDASTIASAEGITAKKFQVEDTISVFDPIDRSGYCGTWVNDTELYPNTDDFNSTAVGGTDLRNEKLRHHRMPSVRWCKQNLYAGLEDYGKNTLDMLGISVENVVIPAEYAAEINGWEIFYAKRNVANSTVLGQSLLLYGARDQYSGEGTPATYFSTGGNFNSRIGFKKTPQRPLYMDHSIYHFHAFDILFNRPSAEPSFLTMELKHRRTRIPYTDGYVEDGAINGGRNNGATIYKLDYMLAGEVPVIPSTWLKAVKDTQYVPNHSQVSRWNNVWNEEFLGGKITNYEEVIPDAEISMQNVLPGSVAGYTTRIDAVQQETTFLSNLMMLRVNLFSPFNGQSLVRAAQSNSIINSEKFYHGDTYICEYTFHTYGRWASNSNDDLGAGPEIAGTRIARRFICETASNLYGRYEISGDIYSKFYPKSPLVDNNETSNYLVEFLRTQDPNQLGLSRDSNALDDIISSDIYNTYSEDLFEFPFRIHRTGKLSRQTKIRNWKTILPLDYYEGQKNMGRLINIEGMDDRLLLHYENALMVTQDKTRLESDLISITLGAGDIFQFQPQEALSAKLGFAGTQHRLSCVRTPFGYLSVDTKERTVFNFKGSLENMNKEMNTFFQEFLSLVDNNPFNGNGITIGYDRKYKRFLLSVKNDTQVEVYRGPTGDGNYENSWIPLLSAGNIVYKNGTYQRFLGINATPYSCPSAIIPVVNNLTIEIDSDTVVGTVIGTATGTDVLNFYLTSPIAGITLNPDTGQITVTGSLETYFTGNNDPDATLTSPLKGISSDGSVDTGIFTLIINRATRPPVPGANYFKIYDDVVNTDVVGTISASDVSYALPLSYAITGGNEAGAFAINASTGVITIADETLIDYNAQRIFRLDVQITNSLIPPKSVIAAVTIEVLPVIEESDNTLSNIAVTVFDDTITGSRILKQSQYVTETGTYSIISQTPSNKFEIDATTKELKTTGSLDLGTTEEQVYIVRMQVDTGLSIKTFNVVVTVWHAKASIDFSPTTQSCLMLTSVWDTVTITKTGAGVISVKTNSITPTSWQGMDLPYYDPVESSVLCSGVDTAYLSTAISDDVVKNDCSGSSGISFEVIIPAGYSQSIVSIADANNYSTTFLNTIKQEFANSYGQCL